MKRSELSQCVGRALALFDRAGIVLTDEERARVEVADFGLGNIERTGLELITYVNTPRVCAKEMALFPFQTCPEHRHVPTGGQDGKEETFRCRYGLVYLYVDGEGTPERAQARDPGSAVSVWHEVVLRPGEQYTLLPGAKHWFQGGPEGAVVSEFSTHSTDETDVFTDRAVVRACVVEEDGGDEGRGRR